MRRAAAVFLPALAALAVVCVAQPARAQPAPDPAAWREVCTAVEAPPAPPSELPVLEAIVRDPAQALLRLCALLRAQAGQPPEPPGELRPQLGLVLLQLEQAPSAALRAWLEQAPPEADLPAQVWGHLLAARQALARLDRPLARARVEAGLAALDAAPALAPAEAQPLLRAALLNARAAARWREQQGDWVRAVDQDLQQAARLLEQQGLAVSALMGELLNTRTVSQHAAQDLPRAAAYAQAEVDLLRQLGRGETPDMLDALASLAAIHGQLEQMDASREALETGLALMARFPEQNISAQLGILHNLAANYMDDGRAGEAAGLAERAIAMAERQYGADSPRLLPYLTSLASSRLTLGQYGAALAVHERIEAVLALQPQAAGPARLLRIRVMQASLWQALGEPAQALQVLDQALPLTAGRPDLGYWRARLLLRRGELGLMSGRAGPAGEDFSAALPLLRESVGAQPSLLLLAQAGRCRAALLAGPALRELPACEQLREHIEQHADYAGQSPAIRARAHLALARSLERRGDWAQALEQHWLGLAAAQSHGGPTPLWENLHGLARHWAARQREDLALLLGQQSLLQIERMRGELREQRPAHERGFLAERGEVFRDQASWAARAGRIAEALALMRDWHALELDEYSEGLLGSRRGAAGLRIRGSAEWGERGGESEPWSWLAGPDAPLAAGKAPDMLGSQAFTDAQRRWREQAATEAQRVREWRSWLAGALVPPVKASEAGVASMARALPARPDRSAAGALHVWAIMQQQSLTLLLVHAGGSEQRRLDLPAAQLSAEVGELLRRIESRAPVDAELRRWHARLGQPIARAARAAGLSQVVLHLDGALRYLPMALLQGPQGELLGERLRFVHAFELQRKAGPPSPGRADGSGPRIQAFGSSQAGAGLPALPSVVQELCDLVAGPIEGLNGDQACAGGPGLLPGLGWLDAGFTRARLEAQLRPAGPAYLHLGTHFSLRPGAMARSWLRLGDGGRLQMGDLLRLPFDGVQLVTLSACATGLGGGSEIAGLNAGLLEAGARQVLASLWSVDDAATRWLMRAFYRELRRHGDASLALQSAQRELRRQGGRHAHPFFWGAFYVARPA